jgi:hypothetical protein
MKLNKFATFALGAAVLAMPLSVIAQESHEDAKAQVEAHDAHHHNKAKIVGGSAVGGAAVGAVYGGPVGAVVGAGVGAGGGLIANKIRKHHSIKKRQKYAHPHQY